MIRESRLTTPLNGLICRACEDVIRDTLSSHKGILSVSVSYIKGVGDIIYDPDVISEEEIKALLEEAGYPPRDKATSGFLYDILTLVAIAAVFIILKILPLPAIPSIMQGNDISFYLNVFLIGLVTGTHCIVMCGGIMLASVKNIDNRRERIPAVVMYNMARVLTSALLGFIFASLGNVVVFSGKMKSFIYVTIGLFVIFSALRIWGVPGIREIEAAFPKLCPLKYTKGISTPIVLGIITAIMPCSASSTMWMTALTLPRSIDGALMMALWSLGTLPAMLIFGIISGRKKGKYYGLTTRINIVLLLSLGTRLVLMGI